MVRALCKTRNSGFLFLPLLTLGCVPIPLTVDETPKACGTSRCGALTHKLSEHQDEAAAKPQPSPAGLQPKVRGQQADKSGVRQTSLPSSVPYQLRTCAWVNDTPIFTSDLYRVAAGALARLRDLPQPEYAVKRRAILKKALKNLIDQEVVYQDAYGKMKGNAVVLGKIKDYAKKKMREMISADIRRSKITKAQYKREMERRGESMASLLRVMERKIIIDEYLRSRTSLFTKKINHDDIREYYDNHKSEFRTEDRIVWENIFIESGTATNPSMKHARQTALKLVTRLRLGEPIAKMLAYDDGDSQLRKGRGFGERKGEIRPAELEPHLFRMKPDQVAMVEFAGGIHLMRLVKREYARLQPLDKKAQAKIRGKLRSQILQREYQRVIRQIISRSVIEVDPDALK